MSCASYHVRIKLNDEGYFTVFYKGDYKEAAEALDIPLSLLHGIMENKPTLSIKKTMARHIQEKYAEKIAYSDALTGLPIAYNLAAKQNV